MKGYVEDTTLQAIADAIRTRGGFSGTYLPSEMPTAIMNIDGGQAKAKKLVIRKPGTDTRLRNWPGWDDATWIDVKFIVDEWNMGRRELPEDIKVGLYKMWGDELFKLNSIVDGTLVFEATSAHSSTQYAIDGLLEELYDAEAMNLLTNDHFFVLSKEKWNIDTEATTWTSDPFVCYTPDDKFIESMEDMEFNIIPMFAIGKDLGSEWTNKKIEENENSLDGEI